jgi:hypothetical protein
MKWPKHKSKRLAIRKAFRFCADVLKYYAKNNTMSMNDRDIYLLFNIAAAPYPTTDE